MAAVDLAVIGSGGAAMAAAIEARRSGAEVVAIERSVLGGTCVNVGCVPSKTLLAAAGARQTARGNPFAGVPTSAGEVDLAGLVRQKDELVGRLRQVKYADIADAHGFEIMFGQARFTGPESLEVDGIELDAHRIVVATGAQPAMPDLDGLEQVEPLTSTTAMALDELPSSLVVIGGGYVGLEQAQLFAHLGTNVTLIGRVAPYGDPELATRLRDVLVTDGITVIEEHATAVAPAEGGVTVTTASSRNVDGQRLLVATGRRPQTDGLGLDLAGVDVDDRGFVAVDAHHRTSNPTVYAAGDVTGAPQHVYVAAATGRVAAANALAHDGASQRVDYTGMPAVSFTRPQLASAGWTETEARQRGHDVTTRLLALTDVPRALANRDTRGAVKIIADTHDHKVLGVHALADAAGEMMLAATYAITAGMTTDHLADTWAPYLTMSESLRLTAQLFRDQQPTSCCA